jgi:hypothetical protein
LQNLLQVDGVCVITTSASGLIRVYELRNDESLHLIFESENVRLPSGTSFTFRPIHCATVSNHHIYYGDDGMNIKVLDWKNSQ